MRNVHQTGLSIAVLVLLPLLSMLFGSSLAASSGGGQGFQHLAIPRTYNLETEEDRYGRYERVLIGLKSSEGLDVDRRVLDKIRQVIFEEEMAAESLNDGERLVAVHLGRPKQSREIAQLQYKNRIRN
ncbi:uncharacterized protein LOC129750785 [Uranotaenia lowii]|uniref:uncharacterized protein LOC129750785 n=1 Tax=Uranotaenia lowii TaxID=190385 RepID=UPI00247B14E4|nr:uncharacterized protein LOC129750785 [Uranotaenia lowii]